MAIFRKFRNIFPCRNIKVTNICDGYGRWGRLLSSSGDASASHPTAGPCPKAPHCPYRLAVSALPLQFAAVAAMSLCRQPAAAAVARALRPQPAAAAAGQPLPLQPTAVVAWPRAPYLLAAAAWALLPKAAAVAAVLTLPHDPPAAAQAAAPPAPLSHAAAT